MKEKNMYSGLLQTNQLYVSFAQLIVKKAFPIRAKKASLVDDASMQEMSCWISPRELPTILRKCREHTVNRVGVVFKFQDSEESLQRAKIASS